LGCAGFLFGLGPQWTKAAQVGPGDRVHDRASSQRRHGRLAALGVLAGTGVAMFLAAGIVGTAITGLAVGAVAGLMAWSPRLAS